MSVVAANEATSSDGAKDEASERGGWRKGDRDKCERKICRCSERKVRRAE